MCKLENRWLPPSPHKEAVLEFIRRGRAHIEEQGHNKPPLLVFEDGGVMELPRVRYIRNQFRLSRRRALKQTKYSDVCSTIDELKKLLQDNPKLVKSNPDRIFDLLKDARYMLSRMQRRRQSYREFASAVGSLAQRLELIGGPEPEQAYQKLDEIRALLESNPDSAISELHYLHQLAEEVRDVANKLESILSSYKDCAIALGALYDKIRGARNWKTDKDD